MSKNKTRNKGQKQSEGEDSTVSVVAASKSSRVTKSFVERLVAKATVVFTKAFEIAKATEKRRAPVETVAIAREFVDLAQKYRDAIVALQSSGWKPSDSSVLFPIVEGSKVSIVSGKKDLYDYIPGAVEGTAKLMVDKIVESGLGRSVQALVTAEDGTPCGYIPRSHLVLR